MLMTAARFPVDFFFSFRSPYSAVAAPLVAALAAEWDMRVTLRPVLPIALRQADFFEQVNPLWMPYLIRDVMREAERQSVPFGPPRPDPVVFAPGTRRAAENQPYIHRLTRLGIAAENAGAGLAFAVETARVIWGGAEDWDKGPHLAEAAAKAGLDLGALDDVIEAEPEIFDVRIRANEAALAQAGHWGVPTLAFQGEPFFGQDRLEALLWRLRKAGMTRRASGPVTADYLVGRWALAHWGMFEAGELTTLPQGENSLGQAIFTRDGVVSIYLQAADWKDQPAGAAADLDMFTAFTGDWRLHQHPEPELNVQVRLASDPGTIGRVLVRRPERLGPDLLRLSTPPIATKKGARHHELTWRRVG